MGLFGKLFGRNKERPARGAGGSDESASNLAELEGAGLGALNEPAQEEPGELVEIPLDQAGQGNDMRDPSEGRSFEARLFEPEGVRRDVPGILWLHGDDPAGGGSSRSAMARLFLDHRPCVVLVVDHPADRAECHCALAWLRDCARRRGIASDQLFIGGTGPGADLAIETALYERDEGGIALAYLMALYPLLGSGWDAGFSSMTRNLGMRGLPASTLIVGMGDSSREDVTNMVERMRSDGVNVDFHMYRTKLRGTGMVGSSSDVNQARTFVLRQLDGAIENHRAPQQRVRNLDIPTVD